MRHSFLGKRHCCMELVRIHTASTMTSLKREIRLNCQNLCAKPTIVQRAWNRTSRMSRGVRFLTYGDSLTAGYHSLGFRFEPYAKTLQEALGDRVTVDCVGLSGWTALQMVQHLDDENCEDVVDQGGSGLRWQLKHHGPYDTVLIMAGTNDLGEDGAKVSDILDNLTSLHAVCHQFGARSIALSIPESRWMTTSTVDETRQAINDGLAELAVNSKGMVQYVNIASEIPYSDTSGMWEPDGLHMQEKGYQMLGRVIAKAIQDSNWIPANESRSGNV